MISTDRKLLGEIRREHTRKKAKRAYRRTAYSVVAEIAARYGLEADFAAKTGEDREPAAGNGPINGPLKRKRELRAPPFALSERKRYLVVKNILEAADNPYLAFARSPEEITLSKTLFAANPDIRPEMLARYHFETLLLVESARDRLAALSREIAELPAGGGGGSRNRGEAQREKRLPRVPETRLKELRAQIKALEEFIFFIESADEREGETWPEN